MTLWALQSRGIGEMPSWRLINSPDDLHSDEVGSEHDPAGLVLDADGRSYRARDANDDLRAAKIERSEQITRQRNHTLRRLTAAWGGDLWDADEATSGRIANALTMIREAAAQGIPTPSTIAWRTEDNKDRILTIAELTQMGAAVFLAQQQVWARQAAKKNEILAAPDVGTLDTVRW
jgi:Domain of unknown function (DUF4376)